MAELDSVADVDVCGCLVGLCTVVILVAFTDGGLDQGQVVIEAAGSDQPEEHLDLLGVHAGLLRRDALGLDVAVLGGVGAGGGRAGESGRRCGAGTRGGVGS